MSLFTSYFGPLNCKPHSLNSLQTVSSVCPADIIQKYSSKLVHTQFLIVFLCSHSNKLFEQQKVCWQLFMTALSWLRVNYWGMSPVLHIISLILSYKHQNWTSIQKKRVKYFVFLIFSIKIQMQHNPQLKLNMILIIDTFDHFLQLQFFSFAQFLIKNFFFFFYKTVSSNL